MGDFVTDSYTNIQEPSLEQVVPEKETEISDYANTGWFTFMLNNPDLVTSGGVDENYNPRDLPGYENFTKEQAEIANTATNQYDAQVMLERHKRAMESYNTIMTEHSNFKKYGGIIAANLVSPESAASLGLGTVGKAMKAYGTAAKIAAFTATGAATTSALTGVSDVMYNRITSIPVDTEHDMAIAAMIGGGLGAGVGVLNALKVNPEIGEKLLNKDLNEKLIEKSTGVQRTWKAVEARKKPISIFTKAEGTPQFNPDAVSHLAHELEIGYQNDNTLTKPRSVTPPKLDLGLAGKAKIFLSDTTIANMSESPTVRKTMARMNRSHIAREFIDKATGEKVFYTEQKSGMDVKNKIMQGLNNRLNKKIENVWANNKEEIGTSLDQFDRDVMNTLLENEAMQQEAAFNAAKRMYPNGSMADEAFKKEYLRNIKEVDWDIKAANKHLKEAAEEYRAVTKEHLRLGKELKTPEFMNLSDKKVYVHVQHDFDEIKKLYNKSPEELANIYAEAIIKRSANGIKSYDAALKLGKETAEHMYGLGRDSSFGSGFFKGTDLPADLFLKKKNLSLDYSVLAKHKLIETSTARSFENYNYWTSSGHAIRTAFPELQGIKAGDDLYKAFNEKIIQPLKKDPLAQEHEIKALERTFNDLAGFERIPNNPKGLGWQFTRFFQNLAHLNFGWGFQMNSLPEIGAIINETGFKSLFSKSFRSKAQALKDIMITKKGTDDDLINMFLLQGDLGELLSLNQTQRYLDMTERGYDRVSNFMQKMTNKLYRITGLVPATAYLEATVGANAIDFILKAGKKLTAGGKLKRSYRAKLARWGITEEQAIKVAKELEKKMEFENGYIKKANWHTWSPETLDTIQEATRTAIESSVMQSNTSHIPYWLIKQNPMVAALTTFLKYPISSYESLLLKGWKEDKALLAETAIISSMLYMTYNYLREEAAVQAGFKDPDKRRFGLDSEGITNNALKSLNYNYAFGFPSVLLEKILSMTGRSQLGYNYIPRGDKLSDVGGVVASELLNTMDIIEAISKGELDKKTLFALKRTVGGPANAPGVSEAATHFMKEWDNE